MITRFQDKTKDNLFYTPSAGGPEGKIPMAATNAGGDNTIKTYKEDNNRIKSFKEYFGEYRKGSDKFGKIVSLIMEFLRLPEFKNKLEENDGLKFELADFEKRSNIKIDKIKQLLNADHNLYSFDINIDDKYIIFSNIKKTYKDRYVSGRKEK
jgi:hypothetical protein